MASSIEICGYGVHKLLNFSCKRLIKGRVLYCQIIPVWYHVIWVREVNEAPNFFKAFTGKNCVKSRSMKQPCWFILDKKSMIRWSDNKIVCSYAQTEERLDFINTRRTEICLPFVSCITCSIHSCFLDDFVLSGIKLFHFILDRRSMSDGVTTKSFAAIHKPKNALISSVLGGLRFACPLCLALLAVYSIQYTAIFSMISFESNLNKRNYLAFRFLDQVQKLHNLQK